MTAEIVYMELMPKQITTSMGSHLLLLKFDPKERKEFQWSWLLRVKRVYEYVGKCETPGECRLQAAKYANMHDAMEARSVGRN